VLLIGSGLAKLFPHEPATFLPPIAGSELLTDVLAVIECTTGATLLVRRSRPVSLLAARFLAAGFAIYSIATIARGNTEGCGCLGGWVELTPWVHLLIVGLFVTALAQVGPGVVDRNLTR
jgi:hypothetical protein